MVITPMPHNLYKFKDPSGQIRVTGRDEAYSAMIQNFPGLTKEDKQHHVMPLACYISSYCKFENGVPYIYDAGYKPLDEVLAISDQNVRNRIYEMVSTQARLAPQNQKALMNVMHHIRQYQN